MSDRPWLEDADPALRVERSLLKKLNAQQPPSGSADHGWAALAAEIGAEALGAATAAHQAAQLQAAAHTVKGGTSLIVAAKIAAGIAVTGGVLWGGSALFTSDTSSVTTRHAAPIQAPALSPSVQERPSQPVPEQSPELEPAPAKALPSTAARPASSATTLAEEGRLLARAHQLVQSGDAQQALEVLRLSASRYPRSVLYQEREVLTIEALGATGASTAARQRAERFVKRYPNSPHAERLKRFVE